VSVMVQRRLRHEISLRSRQFGWPQLETESICVDAIHHNSASITASKRGQPWINLGSTFGQPGVIQGSTRGQGAPPYQLCSTSYTRIRRSWKPHTKRSPLRLNCPMYARLFISSTTQSHRGRYVHYEQTVWILLASVHVAKGCTSTRLLYEPTFWMMLETDGLWVHW